MRSRYASLLAFYFTQGLPFGFQTGGLVFYLTEQRLSLTKIGFAGALAAPWLLKALWAPLVEGTGSQRFGRRRSWILPLELALAVTSLVMAQVIGGREFVYVAALLLAMNFLAATMDIAVDGLALDSSGPQQLGSVNAVQVIGFKLGMISGGGVLSWSSTYIGWDGAFRGLALLFGGGALVAFALRESAVTMPQTPVGARFDEPSGRDDRGAGDATHPARSSPLAVLRAVPAALRLPGAGWVFAFIGTYKIGEALLDAMYKPFLLQHFAKAEVALWVSTWGAGASIVGSLCGWLLVRRFALYPALVATACLRLVPDLAQWWLASVGVAPISAVTVTMTEHFFGGMLTPVVFAFMMSQVDRRIGATHYTLLATIEVLGKTPGGWLSGVLADAVGFRATFAIGAALSALFLVLLVPIRRLPGVREAR